jgi:AAA domain
MEKIAVNPQSQPTTGSQASPAVLSRLVTVRADSVKTRAIQWLWRGKLPLGEITNFSGLPGEGKSMVVGHTIAAVTTGTKFLDGTENTLGPSDVLVLSTEDRFESVLVPRLKAVGADLSRVILINSTVVGTTTKKNAPLLLTRTAKRSSSLFAKIQTSGSLSSTRLPIIWAKRTCSENKRFATFSMSFPSTPSRR